MSRWIEDEEGWKKDDSSNQKGNARYFENDPLPVRDTNGFPLKGDGGGDVDWERLYEERKQE